MWECDSFETSNIYRTQMSLFAGWQNQSDWILIPHRTHILVKNDGFSTLVRILIKIGIEEFHTRAPQMITDESSIFRYYGVTNDSIVNECHKILHIIQPPENKLQTIQILLVNLSLRYLLPTLKRLSWPSGSPIEFLKIVRDRDEACEVRIFGTNETF